MTHYRMSDSMPSAIILAKNPRTNSLDELKIYNGNNIFLNNKDEFQIRLFNPLKEKIGVQIGFNGQLSSSYLVLNPGEDVIVDRFIDDKKRMVFETYKYDDNNPAAKNAVANNGLVEIKFYKEYIYSPPYYITTNSTGNWNLYNCGTTFTTGNATFTTSGNIGLGCINPSQKLDVSGNICCDTSSAYYQDLEFNDEKIKSLKETGRIEKGKESEQNFEQVQVQFQYYSFHNVSYYLRPFSEKNTYAKTNVREYCTNCGYRLRNSSWSFCPKCGNKL